MRLPWIRFSDALADITMPYETLASRHGVRVVRDSASAIDADKRIVRLASGANALGVAKAVNQTALYKEAASALKVSLPKSDMRSSKMVDGITWDGSNPAKYADGFKVRAGAAA